MLKSFLVSSILAVQVTAYWIPSWISNSNNNPNNGNPDHDNNDNNGNGNSGSALDDFAQTMLNIHNQDRANHGVPSLTYNFTAASSADALASSCYYAHNHDGDGQNIAFFTTTGSGISAVDAGERAMKGWYQGEIGNYVNEYGAGTPSGLALDSYAHFTQIVWASTTSVGCATRQCNTMGNTGYSSNQGWISYFTVCDYWPPGNWAGQYGQNVPPPSGGT